MITQTSLKRTSLPLLFLALSVLSAALVTSIRPASAAPNGTYFDHIVIVAMENQGETAVVGNSAAPFITSLAAAGATMTNADHYPTNENCSAGCYVDFTTGQLNGDGVSDGWSCCLTVTSIVDQVASAGLTWSAYCAEGCPRGLDHFPFPGYADLTSNPNIYGFGSGPNGGATVTTSSFISVANSANPPNFLWFTPTDSENMHDNSVSSGDTYTQQFLVGSGSLSSPATGSLLASSLFTNPNYHTLLWLWWDECGGSPSDCPYAANVEYGKPIRAGTVLSTYQNEFSEIATIEDNWGLSRLAGAVSPPNGATTISAIFGSSAPLPLSASFTYLPTTPIASTLVSFTATALGGTSPYSYSWNFGDGSSASGLAPTHTFSASGNYNVTLTVTDSTSKSVKSTQTVQISPIPALTASFTYNPSQPTSSQSVTFSGAGGGGVSPYTYSWNFGDGSTGTGQSPSHTYTGSGSYTITLTITDALSTVATSTQTITVSAPGALTTSFSISPSNPVSGQMLTFTATASGGTGPYTYTWNLGGTTKSGNPVSQSFTNGTYTITLTVTDATSKTATSSQSLTVSPVSTGGGTVPTLVGWGGVRMDESVAGTSGPMSAVFSGEYASNMELLLVQLKSMGYNTVRVDFDPYCTDTSDYTYMSVYSQTNAQRAVEIAQHYGFWIILDYHGYTDIFRNTSCWLSYWKPIVQNIGPLYSNIIWEPENEPSLDCVNSPSSCPAAPCSSDASCVTYLSSAYQQWINQTRSLGDTHWIVVQNYCSYACGFSDMSQGYPTVTDPLGTISQGGKIFISLHSYMDYSQSSGQWTNATADSVAQQYYQAVVTGMANTGWPALNTEGGTDPLCQGTCAPDTVLSGSAGYTVVTFHFIQALVNLYDSNSPERINWVWWPAGSWTNTAGAGTYGAVQCNSQPKGWGCLLAFKPPGPPTPDFTITATSPSPLNPGQSGGSTITISAVNGFTGTVSLTDNTPSGLTCGPISPNSVTGSGTATVSCNASVTGTYSLTITGTSGSLTHSAIVTFTINQPDFTISASSPSPVRVGQSTTTTITITALNGFTGTVTLTDTPASGLTCGNISSTSITGSGTTTISCNATSAGSYSLQITGTSGTIIHTASAIFNFRDFTIGATSPAQTPTGSSATSTISITNLNGFTGTVTLTDSVPSGLSCGAISPSSVSGTGSASLACSSPSANSYTVTITGTSSGLTHSATATFTFGNTPDFSIAASTPSSSDVNSTEASTITITLLNGLNVPVSLAETVPSGLNCGPISSTSFTNSGTATVSCSSASPSSYTVTVTGISGSLTHTASVTFSFEDFSLSASPSNLSINTGAQDISSVSLNALDGFASTVTLTINNQPGVTVALSTYTISGSGTTTLTVNPISKGTYVLVITGTDGSLTRTTRVVVQVGTQISPTVLPTLTIPGPQNATVGGNMKFTVSGNDPTGTGGAVILSATGLKSGMNFDPSTGSFTFTPTKSEAGQTYMVNFTATDSNNPSWTKTESVPIHVQSGTTAPSNSGFCLTCLFPSTMTTTAWLVAIGALIGIVATVGLLHMRASSELAAAKKRVKSLSLQNQPTRTYNSRVAQRPVAQVRRRRTVSSEDE